MNIRKLSIILLGLWFIAPEGFALSDAIQVAKQNEPYLFSIRNHLHEKPEICWEENQSLAFIRSELQKLTLRQGLQLKIYDHYEGGLIADLIIPNPQKKLLFRADIDALSVEEDPSHGVVSQVKGKMHACGHDVHSAMLLTAAKILLTDPKWTPTHTIRFIWQRAEENPGTDPKRFSGAFTLVKENVLQDMDEVYGIHIWSKLPSGEIFSAPKAIFGTANRIKIEIHTSGGHSSAPHEGVNALRVAQALMDQLKEIHIRLLGPTESVSLEPTILKAGTATNAMPAQAELWYTLRTFLKPEALKAFENELYSTIQHIAEIYKAKVTVEMGAGYPATLNHPEIFQNQKAYLIKSGLPVQEMTPVLAAEDFSYYLQKRPGVFWVLGANQPTSGAHHSPTFNPDPEAFHKGVALWLLLATKKA